METALMHQDVMQPVLLLTSMQNVNSDLAVLPCDLYSWAFGHSSRFNLTPQASCCTFFSDVLVSPPVRSQWGSIPQPSVF